MAWQRDDLKTPFRHVRRINPARWFAPAFVILTFLVTPAFAQLPAARLTAVFPPGGRAGTSVDVTVTGVDLDGATELRFSQPGITAKAAGESDSTTERKFTVIIGPDVPVGGYESRFVGAYGISNPRTFVVGDQPEAIRGPATDKPGATPLVVGSVISARCTAGVIDSYSLELKSGQRVLFDCAARAVDSKMVPILVLLDSGSREVDRSRHGGLLDFTAPTDGNYTLQVHDLLYRGGPEYFYRLSADIGPHLDSVFPPAGQAGAKAKYTLYGRNLPGGTKSDFRAADGKALDQIDVEIELPGDRSAPQRLDAAALAGTTGAATDAIAYRLASDKGSSNPVLIGLTRSPLVAEQEPNDKPEQAQKLSPPCEVAGRFYPHGDQDYFTFDAAKGDVFWIEVFSERLGLPTDPYVLVQKVTKNDKGVEQASDVQELAAVDASAGGPGFRTSTRDAAYRLESKDGGTYRLLVRDLFNTTHDNASLVYRLSVRREQPDFRILAVPVAGQNNEVLLSPAFLRKGGALPLRLVVMRQDGFNGEVQVEAEGLPGDVKGATAMIPAGESVGSIVLAAGENAAGWSGPVRIVAHAKVNDQDVTREVRIGTVVWPSNPNTQEPATSRLAQDFALAVSGDEKEPLAFEVADKPYEVTMGGKVQIAVKVRRDAGMKAPLKVKAGGLAAMNNNGKEMTLAPESNEGTLEIDLSQQKLPPGTYTFFLQTQAPVKYERKESPGDKKDKGKKNAREGQVSFYSPPITLKVLPKDKEKDK
ncbi:MAG TPA: hypothetical protein VG269_05920 [Tepidisphaeraceae bacterium]|jgi:hypothetical protein|nr:hypothetical protein [Tepidisphaeraceae bacterium]